MSYTKQDPSSIQALFNNIAPRYERGNAILSFNLHRLWNQKLISKTLTPAPKVYLDLCAGTGDIAFTYLKQAVSSPEKTLLIDFSREMLAIAKEKGAGNSSIECIEGDACTLPLKDASVDAITIAYGIRNVEDPKRCIEECYRVLKPGGKLGILELTKPKSKMVRAGHSLYLKCILPLAGKLITSNKQAYRYLSESIPKFIPPETLKTMLTDASFSSIDVTPLTFGIATLITAQKET